ncbi:MAG: hypothetical protein ACI9OJ_004196 [Myxococcota bacterium]|jgi:hypothetical protein
MSDPPDNGITRPKPISRMSQTRECANANACCNPNGGSIRLGDYA